MAEVTPSTKLSSVPVGNTLHRPKSKWGRYRNRACEGWRGKISLESKVGVISYRSIPVLESVGAGGSIRISEERSRCIGRVLEIDFKKRVSPA